MKIGSLVECILQFKHQPGFEEIPVIGNIYTVRDMRITPLNGSDVMGILLEEIVNPLYNFIEGFSEGSFGEIGFRELQPPMDISIESLISETVEA